MPPRITYKSTSIVSIGMYLVMALWSFSVGRNPKSLAVPVSGGEAQWNSCNAWVSYGYMHNLEAMLSFGAFLFFAGRGLRSQSGPRWFAIAGLISWVQVVEDTWWQINCGGTTNAVLICLCYSSVAIMFLFHAVYPSEKSGEWPQGHRKIAIVYKGVVLAFMLVLSAWFGVYQIALAAPVLRREYAAQIISTIGQNISLPAHLMLLGALALGSYRRVAWSKIAAGEKH